MATRLLRLLLVSFREGSARIRAPLFWRTTYRILEAGLVIRATAAACRAIAATRDGVEPESIILRFSHLFINGWPHHRRTPWVNLNVSRFYWRVARELAAPEPRPSRPPRQSYEQLRIGFLANFNGSFIFPKAFFESSPQNVDVHVFDLAASEEISARYLPERVATYRHLRPSATNEIAEAIEASAVDALVLDVYKSDVYGILDRITTPCVVNLSTTVNLRYHPRVAVHLYFLQQADYILSDGRLFSATAHTWFSDQPILPAAQPFDLHGIDPAHRRTWREREPLIVYHGKLYKLSADYLDCVVHLLGDDSELQFICMGRADEDALGRLFSKARSHGVSDRVHYEGDFFLLRNEAGDVDHPSWLRLVDLLGRARLAPDPWPLAGGCSRFEAYAAGAPVAHMGIRLDRASWGRPQPAVTADQPALAVTRGTAYSPPAYASLCRRGLYEPGFADDLADEQAALAEHLADPALFWQQLLQAHEIWFSELRPHRRYRVSA